MECYKTTEDGIYKYLLVKFKHISEYKKYLDNEARYNKKLARYVNYRDIRDILFVVFILRGKTS